MFALKSVLHGGQAVACIEVDDRCHPLSAFAGLPQTVAEVFAHWDDCLPRLRAAAAACAGRASPIAADAPVLAPLLYPGKVLCAGANYYDHLVEMGVADTRKEAQRLFFFFKPARNAIVGPGKTVHMPLDCAKFDWEVELALVIGRRARALTLDNALDHVAAYTVAIDFSARDKNKAPEQFYKLDWVAGKANDSCCPIGPRLVPAEFLAHPQDLGLRLSVNGDMRQDARTSGMVFDLREQLVALSRIMTLDPGDLVLTGTPAGVGAPRGTFLKPGDAVAAEIEGIGRLEVEIQPALAS